MDSQSQSKSVATVVHVIRYILFLGASLFSIYSSLHANHFLDGVQTRSGAFANLTCFSCDIMIVMMLARNCFSSIPVFTILFMSVSVICAGFLGIWRYILTCYTVHYSEGFIFSLLSFLDFYKVI